ncbi:MAG TPA: adventurous gliding motility protein CglE, partial [Archangium sp.]
DFSAMMPGAAVKIRLVGFDDSQEVKRTWIYVRAGAGVVLFSPQSLLPNIDVLVTAGPGIEYHTRLRHFTIGLEANFNFLALTQTIGFSVFPTVKYAF